MQVQYGNYIKQVNYIINNLLSHHKKRYLFRFVDDQSRRHGGLLGA